MLPEGTLVAFFQEICGLSFLLLLGPREHQGGHRSLPASRRKSQVTGSDGNQGGVFKSSGLAQHAVFLFLVWDGGSGQ